MFYDNQILGRIMYRFLRVKIDKTNLNVPNALAEYCHFKTQYASIRKDLPIYAYHKTSNFIKHYSLIAQEATIYRRKFNAILTSGGKCLSQVRK